MYIGLDVGTSGTKAALVNKSGKIILHHHVNYNFSNTERGYRELDSDMVWEAVKKCLLHVGGGKKVKTITVSTLGEAIIPVDQEGNPLCYSILGSDIRGGKQLDWLIRTVGKENLLEITGQSLSPIYSINKILWLKDNQKNIIDRAWKIFTFQDFIIYRLTGKAVIDYSMASRTLAFDTRYMDWSNELLSQVGLSRELFSEVKPSGSIVGNLKSNIRKELHLSEEVKVITGTHDHICNTIGCGVYQDGWCCNVVGTTEGLTGVIKKEQLTTQDIDTYQISCQPFAKTGLFNTVAWNNTSGVLLRWFVQEFQKGQKKENIVDQYMQLNDAMLDEPTDLYILPHFSGAATPYMDENSKGAILGLTMNTKAEEIYKALMEGANYELAFILECLKNTGLQIEKIVATGGALSPQLLQIKADILGIEIMTIDNKQTGTLGGAILGAIAVNDFKTIEEAKLSMVNFSKIYTPNSKNHQIYQEKLKVYKKIYPAIKDINDTI